MKKSVSTINDQLWEDILTGAEQLASIQRGAVIVLDSDSEDDKCGSLVPAFRDDSDSSAEEC